jgi:hypothetical protein
MTILQISGRETIHNNWDIQQFTEREEIGLLSPLYCSTLSPEGRGHGENHD